jgi:hypothetical protein
MGANELHQVIRRWVRTLVSDVEPCRHHDVVCALDVVRSLLNKVRSGGQLPLALDDVMEIARRDFQREESTWTLSHATVSHRRFHRRIIDELVALRADVYRIEGAKFALRLRHIDELLTGHEFPDTVRAG